MAGANFTTVPDYVIPEVLEYNTIVTQAYGMKKQYQSLDVTPVQRFKLIFNAITNAVYVTIQAHYASTYGQYDNFLWTSVPAWIDTTLNGAIDGTNMTGRWVEGSLSMTPIGILRCNVSIVFEKDV